jgi:hypothetical protein
MTQDDILRMAREAGLQQRHTTPTEWWCWEGSIERFASLIAAAQREKVAAWMRNLGYATGHGDTIEQMLDHLGTQISEGLEVEVLMEREACAKVADLVAREIDDTNGCPCPRCRTATYIATAIRARNEEARA